MFIFHKKKKLVALKVRREFLYIKTDIIDIRQE